MALHRYKIVLSYDGSAYVGWQIQPNGESVQASLERALRGITREKARVHGSSRTDRGVHARELVAHFDLAAPAEARSLATGLNALLPPDIRVTRLQRAPASFHARFSVVGKQYRYFIWNGAVLPPFLRNYRTHVRQELDVRSMQSAAALLVGRHDFAAFTANPCREVGSTVRNLTELRVEKKGPEVVIIAGSDGFLYRMVRSLAGFLIRVGEGALAADEAGRILCSKKRTAVVPTAPPEGLFLWKVRY